MVQTLKLLAVFTGPLLAGFGLMFWLVLSKITSGQTAAVIGTGIVFAGYTLLFAVRMFQLKSESKPFLVKEDDVFGSIEVCAKTWTAFPFSTALNKEIKVAADRGIEVPLAGQVQVFLAILERFEELLVSAREALDEDSKSGAEHGLCWETTELELTEVNLSDGECFTFYLEVPRLRNKLPDGLYVDFADFQVVEAGYVH